MLYCQAQDPDGATSGHSCARGRKQPVGIPDSTMTPRTESSSPSRGDCHCASQTPTFLLSAPQPITVHPELHTYEMPASETIHSLTFARFVTVQRALFGPMHFRQKRCCPLRLSHWRVTVEVVGGDLFSARGLLPARREGFRGPPAEADPPSWWPAAVPPAHPAMPGHPPCAQPAPRHWPPNYSYVNYG